MAIKKAYTVTDLGNGDSGKGGLVNALCIKFRPHVVVKVGGAQGSHSVSKSSGEKFAFSQFGCGTFEGIPTHLSHTFVCSPVGLFNEADELMHGQHISNPLARLTVDERVLLTTSYHGISSRLKEMAKGKNARGIIGVGVGEAALDAEEHPELAIYASDLRKKNNGDALRKKLSQVRDQKRQEVALLYENEFLTEDAGEVKDQLSMLRDDDLFSWVCEVFERFAREVRIVDAGYLDREIFSRDGVVVFEGSHGILTDRYFGFHPHTSRLRTVPQKQAEAVLKDGAWSGDVVRLGVTRSYQIKHGPGPFVVDDPLMAAYLLPDEFGNPDRYRGQVRTGPLDLVTLRYALDVCKEGAPIDALAISWCDTVSRLGKFTVCESYDGIDGAILQPDFFLPDGRIKVTYKVGDEQLQHQRRLTQALSTCRPHVREYTLPLGATTRDIRELVASVMKEALGVQVRMTSFGPTEKDKVFF